MLQRRPVRAGLPRGARRRRRPRRRTPRRARPGRRRAPRRQGRRRRAGGATTRGPTSTGTARRRRLPAPRASRRLVHVSSPSVAHAGRALVGAGAGPADPARARGHYARSKAVAELLALAADSPALAVLAVRPHLVWGPGRHPAGRPHRRRAPEPAGCRCWAPGAALIDTTYVDNAAAALVAAVDACGRRTARRSWSPTASRGRSQEMLAGPLHGGRRRRPHPARARPGGLAGRRGGGGGLGGLAGAATPRR